MFEFRKTNRILKKLEFKEVLGSGSKVVCKQLVVYGWESKKETRLGLIVSKKVGGAIVRNKVKRRLRESFRHLLPNLPRNPGIDLVVIARYKAANSTYQEISTSLENCIRRLEKRLTKNP